jgi:signal transduction histidine kinase
VAVEGSGIGISQELNRHVFDLFVHPDKSLDRAHGGLGIGRTPVRSLVELHGGTISHHSSGAQQDSISTVHLPQLAASAAATSVASPA